MSSQNISVILAVLVLLVVGSATISLIRGDWKQADIVRGITTYVSAIVGVVLVYLIFQQTLVYVANETQYKNASGIAGTVVAMIGTLVGFVAGQASGSAGKEKAEDNANQANKRATLLGVAADSTKVQELINANLDLFK